MFRWYACSQPANWPSAHALTPCCWSLLSQGCTPSGKEFCAVYFGSGSGACAAPTVPTAAARGGPGEVLPKLNSITVVRAGTKQLLACLRSEMGPELKDLVSRGFTRALVFWGSGLWVMF